jgi:3-hydroxyisobutyrate dehydrogenase-like beta-hydroxyacid dehydrogenase
MKIENFAHDVYPMMFSLANMAKDISLAHDEMEKYGLSLDMLTLAYTQYQRGLEEGLGDMDVSAIAKL